MAAALAQLNAMDPWFLELLEDAAPYCFELEYHGDESRHRMCDFVEMYAGTARITKKMQEADLCFTVCTFLLCLCFGWNQICEQRLPWIGRNDWLGL